MASPNKFKLIGDPVAPPPAPPPLSDAQRALVAGSRALWVKKRGFVEDGYFGTHFGTSAREAAAMLEAIGYRYEPVTLNSPREAPAFMPGRDSGLSEGRLDAG